MTNLVEVVAEALWKYRASDVAGQLPWHKKTWKQFCDQKPDIAAVYRDNARVAIKALNEAKQ